LLVEPRTLHVSLSLGIVISVVDFSSQIRKSAELLVFIGSSLTSRASILSGLELPLGRGRVLSCRLSVVVSVFSGEVSLAMVLGVSVNDSSEPVLGALNISVL